MKRIEIIFSQAIDEDVILALKPIPEAQFFTLIPSVRGQGYTTPKMGDAVWPEENEIIIIYCMNDDAADRIETAIKKLQGKYTAEGLAIFIMESR